MELFTSSHTILHWCKIEGFIFSTSLQCLLLFIFLTVAILAGEKWYIIVVLLCISLKTIDVDYLFIYLLTICIFSSKKCLGRIFALLKMDYLFYYWLIRVLQICSAFFWFMVWITFLIYGIFKKMFILHTQWTIVSKE